MQMNELTPVDLASNDPRPEDASNASPEVFQQLGTITRQLHDTLNQLGVLPSLSMAAGSLPDARSRLNYIAEKTAAAANKVLNSVDAAKDDHAQIAAQTRRIAAALWQTRSRPWRQARCSISSATSKPPQRASTPTSPTSCWPRTSTT